jgi:hypothetical protein
MIAGETLESREAAPEEPVRRSRDPIHLGDFFLPLSVVLWAVGLSRTHVPLVQPYGLMTSLPLIYYAGIALLVVSAVIELRHARISEWRMATHAVALVVMLFATAPIVYPAGRYAWLYKTIGVVQYISAHGGTNDTIDIYQNWPGFFALFAWFDKVAGVSSPLVYAKWAQVVVELLALPLLYLSYDSLALPIRRRWVAVLLYAGSNWIGQDYFSPQAFGTVLSLGIMALAIRWLYTPRSTRRLNRRRGLGRNRRLSPRGSYLESGDSSPRKGRRWWSFPEENKVGKSIAVCAIIVVIYFVLSASHQLSPYMVAVQLGALAVAKLLRPRWLPILLGAIAVGYLVPHFEFVNSHYGLLNSLGNLFSNIRPPSQSTAHVTAFSETLIARCTELLCLLIWSLAITGAWLRRRSDRSVVPLLLLAFSPLAIIALLAYGNEGILRVYLFSLPWSAALAAGALVRSPAVVLARTKSHRAKVRHQNRGEGSLRILAALVVVLGLFFPAFFGNDNYNVMPAAEVSALTSFQEHSSPGVIYGADDNFPFWDTSNYPQLDVLSVFGTGGIISNTKYVNSKIATTILNIVLKTTSRIQPTYIVIAPSMVTYNLAYSLVPANSFTVLEKSLADTPPWRLIMRKAGTVIYELPPYILPVQQNSSPALNPHSQVAAPPRRGH